MHHGRADIRGFAHGSRIFGCAIGSYRVGQVFAAQHAWVLWWIYTTGVGHTGAVVEHEQMRTEFGEERDH